jgi:prevent-host-death family protein
MNTSITAKELRATLPSVVERVRRGARYTVVYRSRPAFQVIPVDAPAEPAGAVCEDSLYRAAPLGHSSDGLAAADHDQTLYTK